MIEEVRRIREEYARRFDYDLEAIGRDLRAQEATSGHEVVSLPPKRIPPTKMEDGPNGQAA